MTGKPSDDLRTRIAHALQNMTGDITFETMADAVIRELQLTEDGGVIVGCIHD